MRFVKKTEYIFTPEKEPERHPCIRKACRVNLYNGFKMKSGEVSGIYILYTIERQKCAVRKMVQGRQGDGAEKSVHKC